jgi:hypothetical protein
VDGELAAATPPADQTAPSTDRDVASGALQESQPQEAGLFTGKLVLDETGGLAGVDAFMDQLDLIGAALSGSSAGSTLQWWLLGAVAAGSVCEIAHRHLKAPHLAFGPASDPMFSWGP